VAIEEIKYDFTEHKEHFRNFFSKILKLIIISKLNCLESSEISVKYFKELIKNIENCKTHRVKYGKSIIFAKFMQYEFAFQTIKVIIKILDKNIINLLLESIIPDFVKLFDELSTSTNTIKWNENNNDNVFDKDETINKDIKTIFYLLEAFIETLFYLATIPSINKNDSLMGKMIEIKNVSMIRRNLNIELLIDDNIIILNLSPKKNNLITIILDNSNNTGKTIKEIIHQKKFLI
jgi:hypothetical protein